MLSENSKSGCQINNGAWFRKEFLTELITKTNRNPTTRIQTTSAKCAHALFITMQVGVKICTNTFEKLFFSLPDGQFWSTVLRIAEGSRPKATGAYVNPVGQCNPFLFFHILTLCVSVNQTKFHAKRELIYVCSWDQGNLYVPGFPTRNCTAGIPVIALMGHGGMKVVLQQNHFITCNSLTHI